MRTEARRKESLNEQRAISNVQLRGAGVRWTPLPQAEAPTEPTGETAARRIVYVGYSEIR